jgi:hypothetical protein
VAKKVEADPAPKIPSLDQVASESNMEASIPFAQLMNESTFIPQPQLDLIETSAKQPDADIPPQEASVPESLSIGECFVCSSTIVGRDLIMPLR